MNPDIPMKGRIEFLEYWHAGSGEPGAGDVDDTPVRDARGLPYLPGRTLKGLFHEACCQLAAWKAVPQPLRPPAQAIDLLFGVEGTRAIRQAGLLRFSDARLPAATADYVARKAMQEGLFDVLSATAMEGGVAKARSLRRFEVAVPVRLEFLIELSQSRLCGDEGPDTTTVASWLEAAAGLIRRAGKFRNNGFGRCAVLINPPPSA